MPVLQRKCANELLEGEVFRLIDDNGVITNYRLWYCDGVRDIGNMNRCEIRVRRWHGEAVGDTELMIASRTRSVYVAYDTVPSISC
jgi:hypothetical protein